MVLLATLALAVLALAFGLGGLARPADASARVAYGIGDESPLTMTDPRFGWLGVKLVRLVVPYDAVRRRAEYNAAKTWLDIARFEHLEPLVVFSHSVQRPTLLPSVADYRNAVGHFHRLFPWVRDLGTWDEENHVSQPTSRNPVQAARYYAELTRICATCRIIAADVLDQPGMISWVQRFRAHAPGARLWGLHNYYDLNHGGTRRTSDLLRATRGTIWFTETGGLVWRYDGPTHHFIVRGEAFAERAARRLARLVALSPRIQRVYYYHWRIRTTLAQARRHPGRVTWDSGLIRPNCMPRPALRVLADVLGKNPNRMPVAVPAANGGCLAPPARRRTPAP